jgi:hypothetical protein
VRWSLQRLIPAWKEILVELSLALKSGFPETETVLKRRLGSNVVVAPR